MKPMSPIGATIRRIRQAAGHSLAELAARSGFSKGFLSKIENGHSQPPIATLMRLAEALRVPLGRLFDDGAAASRSGGVLTRRCARQVHDHDPGRGYAFERLAVNSPYALTPYLIRLEDDQEQPLSLRHPGEEVIVMLSGQCDYAVGPVVHRLKTGDTLVFDAEQPHGPIKLPGKRASFLAVFAGRP